MGRNVIPRGGVKPPGGNQLSSSGAPPGANIIGRNGGSRGAAPGASASPHHGGSFFGSVGHAIGGAGHWVAKKSELAAHDIEATPGGLVQQFRVGAPIATGLFGGGLPSGKQLHDFLGMEKQQAHGLIQSVRHPLRDPFQTALTFAPLLHGIGRAAEVGGLKAFDTSTPRLLLEPGAKEPVALHGSKNPTVRAAQNLYDRGLQKSLNSTRDGRVVPRIAAHALNRMAGAEAESMRRTLRMKQVDSDVLDAAAKKLNNKVPKGAGRGVRRLHQAALELTSAQTLPEEAAAYHLEQAAKGVEPAMNKRVAALYAEVAKRGMLHEVDGKVVVNEAKFPHLATTDRAMAVVQHKGDESLVRTGVMTPEGTVSRAEANARIRAGATFRPVVNDNGHFFNQFGHYFDKSIVDPSERLQYHNVHDENGNLVGSMGYDASPGRKNVYVESVYIRPEFRGNPSYLHRLLEPLKGEKRPIHADFQNPRLQRLFERYIARGKVAGKVLPPSSGARIVRGQPPLGELPALADAPKSGFVGGEGARPGGRFVSNKLTKSKSPRGPIAPTRGPVVPIPKKPITSQRFTGASIEGGQVPARVTESVSNNYRGIMRHENTLEARKMIARKFGRGEWQSKNDILIRVPGTKGSVLTPQMEHLVGRKELMTDTPESLDAAQSSLRHEEEIANAHVQPGEPAPKGFKWVDKHVLGQLSENTQARSRVGQAMDELNSLVTTGTVYVKPGHTATRVLTNLATNLIQGSWKHSHLNVKLWNDLTPRDRYRALAASGQHGFHAMPHEGKFITARWATKGANWWAKHADARFRFNSIGYEARKAGFANTPKDFSDFLDKLESNGHGMSAAEWAKVDWVAKRADRAAIAYDRLSPSERRVWSRLIWFYPWVKASGLYVGHTITEHPYKAAAFGQLGKQGEQQQQNVLGEIPSYENSLIPLTGGPNPLTTSFSTFSPTSGATALAGAIARPGSLFDNLTPALAAALALKVPPAGANPKTPVQNALMELFAPTPEAQIAEAMAGRKAGIFSHSARDAIMRALVGPANPRHANVMKLHSARGRELTGR